MHNKSEYAIAAIIDGVGRLAICSELSSAHTRRYLQSISIERYIWNESPVEGVAKQMKSQLGIPLDKHTDSLLLLTKSVVEPIKDTGATRRIYMFIYKLCGPLQFKVSTPKANPISLLPYQELKNAVNSEQLSLSYSATQMLDFIEENRGGVLKDILM